MVPKHLLMTDSKEANEARTQERARFGLGPDYKFLRPARLLFTVEIQDPEYFRLELGNKTISWEDF